MCALLAVALVDVIIGPEVTLLGLFAVAPVVAASWTAARAVVGTGFLAAVVAAALAHPAHLHGSP
ncbi:hypothetical protein [Streptomyces sp. NPDC102283]|uniref:hypothetical protein n=1 Tax=Streptomyces sp. NPDC102283 TaxID=3366155 RepID=UPI0038173E1E